MDHTGHVLAQRQVAGKSNEIPATATATATDPTMPQRQCFRPYGQPTLPLVQVRQQHLEPHSQDSLDPLRSPYTRTTSPTTESHDLHPGKP